MAKKGKNAKEGKKESSVKVKGGWLEMDDTVLGKRKRDEQI